MSTPTALTGVRVFDGERLGEPTTVVIQDGLIAAGGTPAGEVVDGRGAALLPGLIDTHVHVTELAHLEAGAAWGVTTMLDMGCWDASIPGGLKGPFQVPHGESIHEELQRLVAAGLTPAEALRGATSAAAEVFGLPDRGVIAPGRRADLLLVGGDPTLDITATRDIRGVWIGGTRVR